MSDFRETLFSITKNVTKSSGDLIKTTKLSVSLANEQELLKGIYLDIGKKVHEIYLYGGTLGKFFDEKYHEIEASELKISGLKEQINQIKGTRECPKCKKTVEKTSEFCPKCGGRLDGAVTPVSEPATVMAAPVMETPVPPEAQPVTAPVAAPVPATPDIPPVTKRLCSICGAANEPDTKFCLSCGRIL